MSIFRRKPRQKGRGTVPRVLVLEGRALLSATLVVTDTNNDGVGSLRAEVAAAEAGDTIVFSPKVYGRTIVLTSGPIQDAGVSLTIRGPGAGLLTVSGDNQSGIFNLQPSDSSDTPFQVAITGLSLADGEGVGRFPPSAIEDTDASLTLDGDRFVDNQSGSVSVIKTIYSDGRTDFGLSVDVVDSEFLDNQTPSFGGAISVFGVVLDIRHSLFEGNKSTGTGGISGGALSLINIVTTETTTTIDSTEFLNNQASESGGAIWNEGGPLSITSSAFSKNSAPFGGAVEADWDTPEFGSPLATGSLSIAATSFIDNQAGGPDNNVYSYPVSASGGAINASNVNGPVSITGSLFAGNRAVGGDGGSNIGGAASGGAVDFFGSFGASMPFPHIAIDSTTFVGNHVGGGHGDAGGGEAVGGAVSFQNLETATIQDSNFIDNTAQAGSGGSAQPFDFGFDLIASGGAIDSAIPSLAITGGTFSGNAALGGDGGPGGTGGIAQGGAINNAFYDLTISQVSLTDNRAVGGQGGDGGNGGQALGGAISNVNYGSMTVADVRLVGDLALAGAGGDGAGTGGEAVGGGIFNEAAATVKSSLFLEDRAIGGAGGAGIGNGPGGMGGDGEGGGIGSDLSVIPPSVPVSLTVSDSGFLGNLAVGGDGGQGTPDGLEGEGLGGGIAVLGGTSGLSRLKFAGNKASTAGDDVYTS